MLSVNFALELLLACKKLQYCHFIVWESRLSQNDVSLTPILSTFSEDHWIYQFVVGRLVAWCWWKLSSYWASQIKTVPRHTVLPSMMVYYITFSKIMYKGRCFGVSYFFESLLLSFKAVGLFSGQSCPLQTFWIVQSGKTVMFRTKQTDILNSFKQQIICP